MRCRSIIGTVLCAATVFVSLGSEAEAQRRPGVRPYTIRRRAPAVGRFYNPYFGPYYGSFFGPWYGYPYYGYPYYGAYGSWYDGRSGVRVQVKPVETEVYVDGYYAGVVDDFDGFFQRLYLPPGDYEIELHLEGFRTVRERLYLSPGSSYKIHHEMERLGPGEVSEPRPQPREPSGSPAGTEVGVEQLEEARPASPARFGMLALRIRPMDSDILIDGEPWPSDGDSEEFVLHLPTGRHRVEIRREGYESFATEVEVRGGEATQLNVRLPQLGSKAE